MMKIYKLERKAAFRATYDELRSIIVVADTAGQARALAQDAAMGDNAEIWLTASKTVCRQVGWGLRNAQPIILCVDIWEA